MKWLVIILLTGLITPGLIAQQLLNLDFERLSAEGLDRPWGWEPEGFAEMQFRLDSLRTKKGRYSLRASCFTDSCYTHTFRFPIEPYQIRNQTVTLSGWISGSSQSARISLGYVAGDSEGNFEEKEMHAIHVLASEGEWTQRQVHLEIPEDVSYVYAEVSSSGKGPAWFDALRLKVGNVMLEEVAVAPPISTAGMESLEAISYPFSNPDENGLSAFTRIAGNSRVIAMGESTHGTSEFFKMKADIFQYAVHNLGFRVFAIEDNQLAAEEVNKFVLHGEGTAKEAIRNLYRV